MAGYFKALKSAVTGSEGAPYEVLGKHQHFEERSYPAMKWVCTKRKGRSRAEVQKDMFMTLFAYINGKNESNTKIDMTVPVTVSYVQCEEPPAASGSEEAASSKKQNGEAEHAASNGEAAENGEKKEEEGEKKSEEPAQNGDKEEDKEAKAEGEEGKDKKKADEPATNGEKSEKKKEEKEKSSKKSKEKNKEETGPMKEYTMGFYIPKSLQENPPKPSDPEVFIEERPAMTIVTRTFGGYAKDAQWENERANLAEEIKKTPGTLEVDSGSFFTAGYDPPFKPLFRRNEVWLLKTGGEVEVPPPPAPAAEEPANAKDAKEGGKAKEEKAAANGGANGEAKEAEKPSENEKSGEEEKKQEE